jgi:hypothetical protein
VYVEEVVVVKEEGAVDCACIYYPSGVFNKIPVDCRF